MCWLASEVADSEHDALALHTRLNKMQLARPGALAGGSFEGQRDENTIFINNTTVKTTPRPATQLTQSTVRDSCESKIAIRSVSFGFVLLSLFSKCIWGKQCSSSAQLYGLV